MWSTPVFDQLPAKNKGPLCLASQGCRYSGRHVMDEKPMLPNHPRYQPHSTLSFPSNRLAPGDTKQAGAANTPARLFIVLDFPVKSSLFLRQGIPAAPLSPRGSHRPAAGCLFARLLFLSPYRHRAQAARPASNAAGITQALSVSVRQSTAEESSSSTRR